MKNLTVILHKGNLTAKERYLLLIQNDVIKAQTGKEPLSEADKEALAGWKAETNEQAREWNKYNEGWTRFARAGMEVELIYSQTAGDNFRKNIIGTELATYPFYQQKINALRGLKVIKKVDIKEAIEITNKQKEQKLKDGLDFDYTTYLLAFESLDKDYQKDLKELYGEVEYDTEYLDSEEIIANLFNGKKELTKEAKERLAELVAERSYNKFAGETQLYHYFGNIPLMEIAKKWATDNNIKPTQEQYERLEKVRLHLKKKGLTKEKLDKAKEENNLTGVYGDEEWLLEENIKELLDNYAKEHKTTAKEIIKQTCLKWLDEGLLVDVYTPLFNSEEKNTYGEDTKYPHNKIFAEWLKAKTEAKATLEKLIKEGKLKVRERTADETRQDKLYSKGDRQGGLDKEYMQGVKAMEVIGVEVKKHELISKKDLVGFSDRVITGESLYNFKGDYEFIKDFKKRVDNYTANLGIVYADDDKDHKGDNLDKELLISGDTNGIFCFFDMAVKAYEGLAKKTNFWKEIEKDGETYLEFDSDTTEKVFKETRESLIKGYAKLLSFKEIFKKLEKLYEIDLGFFLNNKIESVSGFIDHHNETLQNVLEDLTGLGTFYRKPLKMKEDLTINKEEIKPDAETLKEYTEKFSYIFGDEF